MLVRIALSLLLLSGLTVHAQSINPAANQGQQSQKSGAGANNAAGAGLIAAGSAMMANPPTVPAGIALMAMGMLALAQGSHDSNAAGQSANTAFASDFRNPGTNKADYTGPDKGVAGVFNTADGKKAISSIKDAGGDVNSKGVTMPDGSFKPWSSFSTPSALSAAGFDSGELMKKVAEVEKTIDAPAVKGIGLREAEGPGGGASSSSGSGSESALPALNNTYGMSASQKARLAAGKTIDIGGEPIGTKGDDIFDMIHRVYDRKRDGHHFIMEESGTAKTPPRRR